MLRVFSAIAFMSIILLWAFRAPIFVIFFNRSAGFYGRTIFMLLRALRAAIFLMLLGSHVFYFINVYCGF